MPKIIVSDIITAKTLLGIFFIIVFSFHLYGILMKNFYAIPHNRGIVFIRPALNRIADHADNALKSAAVRQVYLLYNKKTHLSNKIAEFISN